MIRPMAFTICAQRSCSRSSWALPAGGELVVLRLLVGLAHAPLGLQPSALHEAMQRGIEGAGLDFEQVVGLGANGLADPVAMLGTPLEGPENEHVEGALEELQAPFFIRRGGLGHSSRYSTALDVDRLLRVPTVLDEEQVGCDCCCRFVHGHDVSREMSSSDRRGPAPRHGAVKVRCNIRSDGGPVGRAEAALPGGLW